ALAVRDQIRRSALERSARSIASINGAQRLYQPLMVALLARAATDGADEGPALEVSLWENLIRDRLGRRLGPMREQGRIALIEGAAQSLANYAYRSLVNGFTDAAPDDVRRIGVRSGLLRETASGLTFEIRPLEHHLAARALVRQVQATGCLPEGIRIDDINIW